ncbi:U32 family peptidase C-terminal domain-containing protein [Patescibacteria group bacterium]|nr:U32 family peptidase C-terminal domain-containing protein [Patescibacteria group bacterium]
MNLKQKQQKLELIAPAGNLEKMKTAFAFGADAVYAGIPDFSLRVRINDFTDTKLKQAIEYAHKLDKKIFITLNIFAHNRHIEKLPAYAKKLKKLKPDGLIISDPGVLTTVKKNWPAANIHLSTQANCTNWQAAKFWHEQGVKRVILGREVTIDEIKEIHRKVPKLELECFVHGAMCMAYSGRCFLSKFFADRSANLGDCVQPCRWEYKVKSTKLKVESEKHFINPNGNNEYFELVEEEHGSYILNSRDLRLIKRLGELADAGVSAFKIEGRAKSAYYIANVVGVYSHVTHNMQHVTKSEIDFLYNELQEKLYHRGYTEGFTFGNGKMAQNLAESHKKCDWEFCGQVIGIKNNEKTLYKIYIKVHNSLRAGDEIEIVMPFYDIIKMKLEKMVDAKTGEELEEAHGGQGKTVIIESDVEIPEFSVLRRKI